MSLFVFEHPNFKRWKAKVEANGNIIQHVDVLSVISRDQVNLFYALLDCHLLTPEGNKITRCLLLSGDGAVIIPVLTCLDDLKLYTLMVEQRRIVDGDLSLEFASGRSNDEEPLAIACQEVQEELNLTISQDELIPLNSRPFKVNPDHTDGLASFYYFKREVSLPFLKEIDGSFAGCREDQENIRIRVCTLSEAANVMTPSAMAGIKLLERALNQVF